MILNLESYTPSIRWRQGEYQALLFLPEQLKDRICPLITIPPVEFDFELQIPKKSAHEHIQPFAKRVHKKWGNRPCWVDVHPSLREAEMDDGRISYEFVFQELREFQVPVVPILSLDMSDQCIGQIRQIVDIDQSGLAMRLTLVDLMNPTTPAAVFAKIESMGLSAGEVDLIIDIAAPNFDPLDVFEAALMDQVNSIGDLHSFRNYCLIGTAFPETVAGIPKGLSTIPRQHWILYKQIVSALSEGARAPCFGDYTVTHPDFVALDMRLVKPAGKVIYTIEDAWLVAKGGSFRDNRQQMHSHSQSIWSDPMFRGASYSFGDHFIEQCATHQTGPSNLSRWKCVGVNHHMTTVLDDLANYHAGA